jgi:hypothetical protein
MDVLNISWAPKNSSEGTQLPETIRLVIPAVDYSDSYTVHIIQQQLI